MTYIISTSSNSEVITQVDRQILIVCNLHTLPYKPEIYNVSKYHYLKILLQNLNY